MRLHLRQHRLLSAVCLACALWPATVLAQDDAAARARAQAAEAQAAAQRAAYEYFTHGADATRVPQRGEPGAEYFYDGAMRNGAKWLTVPKPGQPGAEYFYDGANVMSVPSPLFPPPPQTPARHAPAPPALLTVQEPGPAPQQAAQVAGDDTDDTIDTAAPDTSNAVTPTDRGAPPAAPPPATTTGTVNARADGEGARSVERAEPPPDSQAGAARSLALHELKPLAAIGAFIGACLLVALGALALTGVVLFARKLATHGYGHGHGS